MKNKPLVTIVTATFNLIKGNRKETFLQTVESVKNQTYENVEHLIIDGGSNDGSVELFKSLGLKCISEPDKGIYDAFNKGVLNASGKYVCFLNSDDFFNNNRAIELSVRALEKTNAAFSFAESTFIDENDKFLCNYNNNIAGVFSRMPFCHQTMFTRVDVLKKEGLFNLKYKSASDYDFIIRLMLKKYKYVELKDNISTFRVIGESAINPDISIKEQYEIFKTLYSKFLGDNEEIYKNIVVFNFIPVSLLYKNKIYNPKFYIRNIKKDLKYRMNWLLSFSFNFKEGDLKYCKFFGKWVKIRRKGGFQDSYKFLEELLSKGGGG